MISLARPINLVVQVQTGTRQADSFRRNDDPSAHVLYTTGFPRKGHAVSVVGKVIECEAISDSKKRVRYIKFQDI